MADAEAEDIMSDVDTTYFASYEDLSVHELMLKDKPRTLAYKDFIEKNPSLFKDKVVIDVGAGTGILSLFAAKAGAKKVYAVEGSKLSYTCALLIKHNGYSDIVEVVHSRVEEAELDNVKADVMISEWMGFYLLHESMLDSLIVARDKWLSDDGLMVPSMASIYLCPVEMKEYNKETFGFWSNVYGFDFSPLVPLIQHQKLQAPVIQTLTDKQQLAEPELITSLDLQFVTTDDIQAIHSSPTFTFTKNALLHGFACWFDCQFEGEETDVTLSTSPASPATHWQQTVIMLPDALMATKGETVSCQFELVQDKTQQRRYNITIQLDEDNNEDEEEEEEEDEIEGEMDFHDDIRNEVLKALDKQDPPKDQ